MGSSSLGFFSELFIRFILVCVAIGQALGPLGINMAEFCKQFNEKSESLPYAKDTPVGVKLRAMSDRTFTFDIKSPPTSWMIMKAAGIKPKKAGGQGGAKQPSADQPVGFITPEQVFEIARIKHGDSVRWHLPLEGVARSVIGTAKSMGVAVKEYADSGGN